MAFDVGVIALNQIMYTFHREQIFMQENVTRESWWWGQDDFKKLNPLFKYDYDSDYQEMFFSEI